MPELFAVFGVVGRGSIGVTYSGLPGRGGETGKMEQIVVVQEAQTDKVSLMQIDNNGIQPDTLATAMLTDVNETVTHQTEEEIVEEPFYVSWNYWQIAWIVYGSGVFILWCIYWSKWCGSGV